MIDAYIDAAGKLFTAWPLFALALGVAIGLINGALPAGGSIPLLIILMGFAYGMDPYVAIPLVIGAMAVNGTTDPIPCILLGILGSASAQATILDGHPLAQQGRAGYALSAALNPNVLAPIVLAMLFLSGFQTNRSMGDLILICVLFGVGWFMKRYGWPRVPIILGLVLAEPLEKYMWLSLNTYGLAMLARPQVWSLVGLSLLSVVLSLRAQRATGGAEITERGAGHDAPDEALLDPGPIDTMRPRQTQSQCRLFLVFFSRRKSHSRLPSRRCS